MTMRYANAEMTVIDVSGKGAGPWVPTDPGNGMYRDILDAGTEIAAYALSAPDLAAYAAAKRYRIETGGCGWSGHIVNTDRDSQAKMIAEYVAMGAGLRSDPSPWKLADGFVDLSNADLVAVIMAARAHIAAAFATEAQVLADIAAGSITSTDQIDAANWPANS